MSTTGTVHHSDTDADRALKAKHRSIWASGDYPTLAAELISELGPILVSAAGVRDGQLVLDVAAGSGNVAIPAARTGASVVASDLTPELFDAGRTAAGELEIDWRQADVEALPFPDAAFDTVLSCVGVMFAPHHQVSADELVRVCRPGGTLGLINWTPEGFIGQLFATMKPFSPPTASRRAAAAAVGRRGARARPARRPGHRCEGRTSTRRRGPLSRPDRLPRLLHDPLRPHDRDVPFRG